MSSLTVNEKDTVALEAQLPRDLTNATVTFLFGQDETEFQSTVSDPSSGTVAVPLSQVEPSRGSHEIKWQIEYADGTIEVLPPTGDSIYVSD